MRKLLSLIVASLLAGCQTPLPPVDPQMAWVNFSTPTPGGKLLMAERLDNQRLNDGRYFQVTPGSHELRVRFDFEVFGGGGALMTGPVERLCYLYIRYDHFEAGQRYLLEGRSLAFTPSARLYNARREIVAEDRQYNCIN
ncbi:hypothetical protein J3D48_001448 [Pseudomonas fluorescens]|uniref:PA0061/PA0062 family lipoprotein n=1 Tax=Pseudomonas fluorescens TaxID=294 RepID=UPI00209DA5D3|nr:hypothetical protein [Pseudomonas fluorescens]MCP1485135.1 hypothetical protein [Pseudomonas fluorescens]